MLISSRTGDDSVVALDLPEDFHQVPLDQDVRRRTASQLALVDALGLVDPGQREAVSLYLEAVAGRLSEGSVAATAFCAVTIEGHPSSATLTVGLRETHSADRGVVAMAAAETLRRDGRYQSVRLAELGQHPAVVAVSECSRVPGDTVAGEADTRVRELMVLVPMFMWQEAAVVTLSTPRLDDWDVYERMVLDVCRTVHVLQEPSPLDG